MAVIIDDRIRQFDARLDGDRMLVDVEHLSGVVGWELKPEGLCRDEVCVPVRDRDALLVDGQVDVAAVAAALGRPSLVDAEAGIIAVALPAEQRREALTAQHAPAFTLDDLDGQPHSLGEWAGQKKLLVAFASW